VVGGLAEFGFTDTEIEKLVAGATLFRAAASG